MRALSVACLLGLLLPACCTLAGQLEVPEIGYYVEPSGALRPVTGIGGNLLLGGPVAEQVRAAAFSRTHGLVHAGDRLLLVSRDLRVLAGLPVASPETLVAVSQSEPLGVAWLPQTGEICRLRPGPGAEPDCFAPAVDGTVLAVGVAATNLAALAVERNQTLWLVLIDLDGERTLREARLIGVAPPLALLGEEILYWLDGELILRRGDGSEIRSPSPLAAPRFQPVGPGWVSLRGGEAGAPWMLRVSGDRLETYRLPGGAP
jgi:hypothetical protein